MCALFSNFELGRLKNEARTDIYNGALHTATPFNVPYLCKLLRKCLKENRTIFYFMSENQVD